MNQFIFILATVIGLSSFIQFSNACSCFPQPTSRWNRGDVRSDLASIAFVVTLVCPTTTTTTTTTTTSTTSTTTAVTNPRTDTVFTTTLPPCLWFLESTQTFTVGEFIFVNPNVSSQRPTQVSAVGYRCWGAEFALSCSNVVAIATGHERLGNDITYVWQDRADALFAVTGSITTTASTTKNATTTSSDSTTSTSNADSVSPSIDASTSTTIGVTGTGTGTVTDNLTESDSNHADVLALGPALLVTSLAALVLIAH